MKITNVIVFLMFSVYFTTSLKAQTNPHATCTDAQPEKIGTKCNFSTHYISAGQHQYWISFVATSQKLQLNSAPNGPMPDLVAISLLSGNCTDLQLLETDTSVAIGQTQEFASALTIGQEYFIRIDIASSFETKVDICTMSKTALNGNFYFTDQDGDTITCGYNLVNNNVVDSVYMYIHECQELNFCLTDTICVTMSSFSETGQYTYPDDFDLAYVLGIPFATTTYNSDFTEACLTFNSTGTTTIYLNPGYNNLTSFSSDYVFIGGAVNQWLWTGNVVSFMNINVFATTPEAQTNSEGLLCFGQEYTIEGYPGTTITSVSVDGAVVATPNSNTWSTTFSSEGEHIIQYTVDGLCSPHTYYDTVNVINSDTLIVEIDACNQATFTFTACGDYTNITLNYGDGTNETIGNFTGSVTWTHDYSGISGPITWNFAGYQIIYIGPSPVNTLTYSQSGTVQPAIPQPITLNAPLYLCEFNPSSISITAPSNLQNIVWTITPNYPFTGQGTTSITPLSWPTDQGDIAITVTATDLNGCHYLQNILIEECCLSQDIVNSGLNGEIFEKTYLTSTDFQNQLNSVSIFAPVNVTINLPAQPSLSSAISTPFATTITENELLSLTGATGNTITTGKWLFINNDVFINNDLTILDCSFIRIAPGKKLIVNPGVTLTVQNSTLGPKCDEMWGGILLNSGTSNLISLRSHIISAKAGVESVAGAPFNLVSTFFIDNYTGVVVNNFPGTHPGKMSNCYFGDNTSTNLLAPYTTLDRPMYGVLATRVNWINIGETTNAGNTFHKLRVGILTRQCNVNVRKNLFFQIVENPSNLTAAGAPNYYAIRAIGNPIGQFVPHRTANIGFGDQLFRNIFLTCRDNISLESNMNGRIHNNYLRNITYHGVWAVNNVNGQLEIVNNDMMSFNSNAFGALILQHAKAQVLVENNRINSAGSPVTSRFGAGVYVGDVTLAPATSTSYVKVQNNIITNAVYGVLTLYVNHPYVADNKISWSISQTEMNTDPGYSYSGIYIAGSPYAEVYRNDIQNTYLYNPLTATIDEHKLRGIRLENSPSSKVKFNYMLKTPAGFNAAFQNGTSQIYCNTFARNKWGFFFQEAEIGDQGLPANLSASAPNGLGADNKWTLTPTVGYRSDGTRITPIYDYLEYYHTAQIPNPNQYYSAPTQEFFFTYKFHDITLNTVQSGQAPISSCNNNSTTSITLQDNILERKFQYGRFIDGSIPDSLPYQQQQRFAKEHTYRKMMADSAYLNLGVPDDTIYVNFMTEFSPSNTKKVIEAQIKIMLEDYNAASLINASITTECFHSENNKQVQDIYLASLDSGLVNIAGADSTFLEFLACQDPMEYGNGVYQARALIGWLHPCDAQSQNRSRNLPSDTNDDIDPGIADQISIYPNPSHGRFTVDAHEQKLLRINIIDLTGKIVYSTACDQNRELLNLEGQLKGIYIIEAILETNAVHRNKIYIN